MNKNRKSWKIRKISAAALVALLGGIFSASGYYSAKLPEKFVTETGCSLEIAGYPEITCGNVIKSENSVPSQSHAVLSLFGAIPVKSVEITEKNSPVLAVGGNQFGIKLLMDGVMVTDLAEITDKNGDLKSPAKDAGIEKGDIIILADGNSLLSNAGLHDTVNKSGGQEVRLKISRDGREFTTTLKPVLSAENNSWECGMWVRDSIAGIGTMTFINPETGQFAGLGHPICDSDTGEIVPIQSGEAVPIRITGVKKGVSGSAGELRGQFSGGSYGSLDINSDSGVFGTLDKKSCEKLCENAEIFRLGHRQEIKEGEAYIYTCVSGQTEKYSAEIESVDYSGSEPSKNMVIKITDKRLIDQTGGIVQGMSGSPIIQNDMIVGAVTHVFVSAPTRGYGIFAENMVKYLDG